VNGLWAFQQGKMAVRELADPPPPPAEPAIAVRFAEVDETAALTLAEAIGQGTAQDDDAALRVVERIRRDLGRQRRCFAAWREGQIASYCWISLGQEYVGEMERVLKLLPGEAYIWNCATLPDFRRNGIYTALLGHIMTRLSEDGLQRVWIGADLENEPSHRAFASAGFRPAAFFTYLRLWRFYGFRASAPRGAAPQHLAAARRLFQLSDLPRLGSLSLGWLER
jgi:ribosomal protein S18 acetylase RimI-like enzyme